MGNFLRALEKVGLVELEADDLARLEDRRREKEAGRGEGDGEDLEELLASTRGLIDEVGSEPADARPPPPEPQGAPAAGPEFTGDPTVEEGRSFEDLYNEARIPTSPYGAEKLLRLLDGLRAMEPSVRKTAILAMDAADEAWTIDDAVLDAQRKIRTLQAAQSSLAQRIAAAEKQAQDDLAAQEQYKQEATATIRQQITEMEAMLEEELSKVAEEKAGIRSRVDEQRGAAARESHRLEQEMNRLDQVPITFADTSFKTHEPSQGS